MCGIAGIFGRGDIELTKTNIERMLAPIAHRGPDGSGVSLFNDAGLGHVRLAIIDIEGGQQPMASTNDQYHLSYNGEIYNFQELRSQLLKKGYHFKTTSDTEVVLNMFIEYGVEAFSQFRGMFAVAIWDNGRKAGWLARDQFGIKPLFIRQDSRQLHFASEIKALLPLNQRSPEINLNALHQILNYRYIPGNETLFHGVQQLAPGSVLAWSDSSMSITEWGRQEQESSRTDVHEIREALERAVKRQLVSDVPVGAYLSGGIDSATIVALVREQSETAIADFPTFTIQTGDDVREAIHAAETANFYRLKNFQAPVNGSLEKVLSQLIYHLEVPKVNSWQSALVAQLASSQVKVALSGLGGDEIFLGYNMHSILKRFQKLHQILGNGVVPAGRLLASVMDKLGKGLGEFARGGRILAALPDFAAAYGIIRNVWDSAEGRKCIYGPGLLSADLENAFDPIYGSWHKKIDPVKAAARFEIKNKMANDLLLQEDRLSMAFGLEVRVPFLDEDLVQTVSKVSTDLLMESGVKKALMKNAVSKWVPDNILMRKKSGFQVPIHAVFNEDIRPLADVYLEKKRINNDGLFNYSFIENILNKKPHPRLRWHYFMLYLMIGTNIWIDTFIEGKATRGWTD